MDKYIKDGMVAVLYSPGFGAGWFTWNSDKPECLFSPELAQIVEQKDKLYELMEDDNPPFTTEQFRAKEQELINQIQEKAAELFGGDGFYTGGAGDLTIAWLPQGTPFRMKEYDGSESIELSDGEWIYA